MLDRPQGYTRRMSDQPPAAGIPVPRFVPYQPASVDDPVKASQAFLDRMRTRRSVRFFSDRPVEREVIENIILTAGTAPSGANKQPWRFAAVQDPTIKREIRAAAEEEEREFYARRANQTWLRDLRALGTDDQKPFLEIAPWLIVVFKMMKDDLLQNGSDQVYYVSESVGIACGLLLAAIHHAGLVALTHTPSPMKFLTQILRRPEYERPYLLIPVGYPAPPPECLVPDIQRKTLDQIMAVDR
jgi:nitroreductase